MTNILYVFGGEKAQGAEIVIERLMCENRGHFNIHLLLAPGHYANGLLETEPAFKVGTINELKKLNRSENGIISYLFIALRNYFMLPIKINRYISRHNIKVVHANTIVPASYLSLLILYCRVFKPTIKWIWSDHDMRYFTGLEKTLARICSSLYDRTLVVSQAVSQKYEGINSKIRVLYNGLDLNLFMADGALRSLFRTQHALAENETVIGIAAVIHEDKGQLQLIEVFKQLLNAYTGNLTLILAGNFAAQTPDYQERVLAAISGQPRIVHLGFVISMRAFYNGCDIIVSNTSSYRSESLGTTIYEAMACEKLVVASNTGGTPEIITDQRDGFLFTPDDPAALLNTLLAVLQQKDLSDTVRINARKKVASRFNLKTMAKNYRALLAELKLNT